ncbi:uncharacterized protein LOC128279704 [Gossypium arboreum]|uniref:uncharacterized protein LOC128279704 n=1 Tax=Gossypium arboreum TaxID=29729 RepID=UPI0022F17602|nr:uncharacterized protein LOC128279704 [Gossypium arboreum]
MLRILERVAGPNLGFGGRGSVTERLRSIWAELFRGVVRVAPNVAEYWMEATERIMDDLDFTVEQKFKGAVSQLRDEAYQWWLTGKYARASYIDAMRCKFLNLTQGDRSVAEYEVEFLRLIRYARGMVVTKYMHCVQFEDGLRDSLQVLLTPQRERDFSVLVEKVTITEEVKRIERQNREKGKNKRELEPSSSAIRLKKRPDLMGQSELGPLLYLLG